MKIALIGFGKMGREIDSIAREQGDVIARVFDSRHVVRAEALADVDVCIEFSTPDAVLQNIRTAIEARRDIIVGTTGWDQHLPEIKAPMLFCQGSRDTFGTEDEIRGIIKNHRLPARIYPIEKGDHSFKVPKSLKPQQQVYEDVMDEVARWVSQL